MSYKFVSHKEHHYSTKTCALCDQSKPTEKIKLELFLFGGGKKSYFSVPVCQGCQRWRKYIEIALWIVGLAIGAVLTLKIILYVGMDDLDQAGAVVGWLVISAIIGGVLGTIHDSMTSSSIEAWLAKHDG